MRKNKIYIAGHTGMVGSAIKRKLEFEGFNNLLMRTRKELDLMKQSEVEIFFETEKPEIVIIAAGKVGGIGAIQKYPAEFIFNNLIMWLNVIKAAADFDCKKLLFIGSATVYSDEAKVPFKEEDLLVGPLNKSIEPYAIAKISTIKLCEEFYRSRGLNFLTLTTANLYGPNDHFESEDAHVVPSIISKIYNAKKLGIKEVELWGTGKPTRDLLFVEDLADAIEFSLKNIEAKMLYDQGVSHLNVGTGIEHTIEEIAQNIGKVLEYEGDIKFDISKPDGTMRKSVDTTRINKLGWRAQTSLEKGLLNTCKYYLNTKK
ncbi:MAG TPA: GDP-L-fucose synthase [Ignavibacteriaceae bacterium]|nr:GDP-L-fucose synthase [Ignavibacteriaceae bacterium]